MEDVWDRNGFVSLFANTENSLWGLAPDRTIESKMEMMFAYSPIHSDYKVIRINSYKEFEPYRCLGKEWCISDGEDIFNVYAEDGKNTLFLLKRKDAHKGKREIGEGFPKEITECRLSPFSSAIQEESFQRHHAGTHWMRKTNC